MNINEYLRRISDEAPDHFKKVVKTKKDNGGDIKGFTKEAKRLGKISKEEAYELEKMQAEGRFDHEYKEIDDEISSEMKEYIDQRIEEGIREGLLDRPTEEEVEEYKRLYEKWSK